MISKFCIITIFTIIYSTSIKKFHLHRLIAIKLKAKNKIFMVAMLLFYILQKYYKINVADFCQHLLPYVASNCVTYTCVRACVFILSGVSAI
jgi:hypothetical protein